MVFVFLMIVFILFGVPILYIAAYCKIKNDDFKFHYCENCECYDKKRDICKKHGGVPYIKGCVGRQDDFHAEVGELVEWSKHNDNT